MKFYINDMLVKSLESPNNMKDLVETCLMLRHYNMKLNSLNFTFSITLGKILAFFLTHRGIEANVKKIQAIQEDKRSSHIQDVQCLIRRVVALNSFVC